MKILIVDDELNICLSLQSILEDEGYECNHCSNGRSGLELMDVFSPDLVLLDVQMHEMNGLEVLEKIKNIDTSIQVIMISGHSGITEAVKAMRLGAFDFLEKPLSLPKVKIAVKKALEYRYIQEDYNRLRDSLEGQYKIIGDSKEIKDLMTIIQKVAITNAKVLIRGESGTGKELIAYAIHNMSPRKDKAFIKFNSAAIPNELVESELFGYEKGAFTGAIKAKKGKIELADKGTLFLDEIGDMSLSAQAKILRVMQEGEFERVGGNKTEKIDARIVAATHKNLEEMVSRGEFREDLFYRLNVVPITAPALRDHIEDIPLLIDYFSNTFSQELNIKKKNFSPKTVKTLQSWNLSGNVRELRNLVERLYILVDKATIDETDLPQNKTVSSQVQDDFWTETKSFSDKKDDFEKRYLKTQLELNDNSITKTALALGLQQGNLSRKLKELGLS